MADLFSTLSPRDRQNLGRNLGITLPDGRKFKNGVLISAQDAANTEGTRARDAAFSLQTGPYGRQDGPNPNEAGAKAYAQYMGLPANGASPAGGAKGQQAQAVSGASGAAPVAGQPSPYEDLLNRARLGQATYNSGKAAPISGTPSVQPNAGLPSATPIPPSAPSKAGGTATFTMPDGVERVYGGIGGDGIRRDFPSGSSVSGGQSPAMLPIPQPYNPNASASYTRPDGTTRTLNAQDLGNLPPTQGFGFPESPASADQQATYARQLAAPTNGINGAPAPDLLRPRSVEEINAMSPVQRAALVQFTNEQKAANAPKEVKVQSYRSQDAKGNPIEVSVDQYGREVGKGPVRPTSTTNIISEKGEGEAEKVVGKAEGEFFTGLAESADKAAEATSNLEKIRTLYGENAYSGPLATTATKLKQIGATLGIIDANSAATQDQLQAELAKGVLTSTKEFFKGMGALSNLEGAKAESAVANLSRTPEGNLRILEWQNANAPTIIEGNRLKEAARAEGKSITEANSIARKFMRENYKKLSEIKADSTPSPATSSPAASPAPAITPPAPVQPLKVGRFTVTPIQ